MHRLGPLSFAALVACLVTGCGPAPAPRPSATPSLVLVEVPGAAPRRPWEDQALPHYPAGTRLLLLEPASGAVRMLSEGFDAAAWPALAPDGHTLAFAARRRPGERWALWTLDLAAAGAAPQALPGAATDCLAPEWLADGGVVALCSLGGLPLWVEDPGALFRWAPGAAAPERISFDLRPLLEPVLLPAGRLLFARRSLPAALPGADTPREQVALLQAWPDGTETERCLDGDRGPEAKWRPRRLGARELLFVGKSGASGKLELFRFDPGSPNSEPVPLRNDLAGALFSARALPGGDLLLSLMPDGSPRYQLFRAPPSAGSAASLVAEAEAGHLVDAVPVLPRPSGSPHASQVRSGLPAWLYLLDASSAEPDAARLIQAGTVGRARLVTGVPAAPPPAPPDPDDLLALPAAPPAAQPFDEAGGNTPGFDRRVLGEFEVQADGSFLVQVPADVPLTLQLLTRSGELVRDVGGWFWLRPNEQRGCVGCHEHPARVPENRRYEALARPPSVLVPGEWGSLPTLPAPIKGEPRD